MDWQWNGNRHYSDVPVKLDWMVDKNGKCGMRSGVSGRGRGMVVCSCISSLCCLFHLFRFALGGCHFCSSLWPIIFGKLPTCPCSFAKEEEQDQEWNINVEWNNQGIYYMGLALTSHGHDSVAINKWAYGAEEAALCPNLSWPGIRWWQWQSGDAWNAIFTLNPRAICKSCLIRVELENGYLRKLCREEGVHWSWQWIYMQNVRVDINI